MEQQKAPNRLRWGVKYGAGDAIRTRDIYLGKVVLYQLSYSRALTGEDQRGETKKTVQILVSCTVGG